MLRGIEPILERTGDTPMRFAGRILGLGTEQQRAGVPKWAWLGVGLIGGAAVVWVYGEDIKRFAGSLRR
jgi:hypothetical protein